MLTFAELLKSVRKERNITQESLANMMNVSRPTVSHWENGRIVPDFDTIKRLSKVLSYNFFADESAEMQAALASETENTPDRSEKEDAQEAAFLKAPSAPFRKQSIFIGISVFILLCALALIFFTIGAKQTGGTEKPASDAQQPAPLAANVIITPKQNPCPPILMPDLGDCWIYTFNFEETAGVPFTAETLTETVIGTDDSEFIHTYVAQHIKQAWADETLYCGAPRNWRGGMPVQDIKGVRLTLSGTDANGNKLSFESFVELSREKAE